MGKLNADMKAGTDAATVTDVQVNHVSQTIAKPHVMRSFSDIQDEIVKLKKDKEFLFAVFEITKEPEGRSKIEIESYHLGQKIKILEWVLGNEWKAKKHYALRAGLCAGVALEFRPPTTAAD